MSRKGLSVCNLEGCYELTPSRYCTDHQRAKQRLDRSKYDRNYYGSEWPSLRKRYLATHPHCQCSDPNCGVCYGSHASSKEAMAVELDHIVPLRYFTDRSIAHQQTNLKGLCKPCHSSKTMRYDKKDEQ